MKTPTTVFIAALLALTANLRAQEAPPSTMLDPAQLDQLLSPIALYPDPLLGAMLPAATHPGDIAAAAAFASANADPAQIEQQPWDDSIKVLAHYPTVVEWMAQNPDWTNQLGTAVAYEEPAVFESVQRLRANARASGMLVDTPQQRVVVENNVISIVPAQPDTVYIPSYDPQYVETTMAPGPQVGITFGIGYAIGNWPAYGVDWRSRSVWIDRRRERGRDWTRFAINPPRAREQWQPPREFSRRSYTTSPTPVVRVPRPARYSERNWQAGPGRTPTGRINSPAMEYNGQPQMRWNERRPVAPAPRPNPERPDARSHHETQNQDTTHPDDRDHKRRHDDDRDGDRDDER